jgi:3-phenylpropionate/trans-cinnamate dioxygenase ferredoxin reductase subunit
MRFMQEFAGGSGVSLADIARYRAAPAVERPTENQPAMSESPSPCVVVIGAGQAACELAFSLRQQGYADRIILVGDESLLPYRRPPLSKAFLAGEMDARGLLIRSEGSYAQQNIECLLGRRVVAVDRERRTVSLDDGGVLSYSHLVFATGGRARALPLPGGAAANVYVLRNAVDAERLQGALQPGQRLAVIGGGYIGLEVAAMGIKRGLSVTVIEALPRVLARVAVPEMSAFYEAAHRRRGVTLLTGQGVRALEGEERVHAVVLADGQRVETDVLVVGIGIQPNVELAEAAGLAVDNGIVVDATARTADPAIYAIGDCAQHEHGFLGRRLRLESVPHAMEHARVAAAAICGAPKPYEAVPWFWSDQFDLKLQMVGLSEGHDQMVCRGSIETESFCLFYLKSGVVISADAVNRTQEFSIAKQIVARRMVVSAEALADESQPLKTLV